MTQPEPKGPLFTDPPPTLKILHVNYLYWYLEESLIILYLNNRWRYQTMPSVPGAHREDGRRLLQPHDVRSLWLWILLALHERDQRPALPQPVRLYFLGEETLVPQEEDPLAVGHSCWSSCWDRSPSWHRCGNILHLKKTVFLFIYIFFPLTISRPW